MVDYNDPGFDYDGQGKSKDEDTAAGATAIGWVMVTFAVYAAAVIALMVWWIIL